MSEKKLNGSTFGDAFSYKNVWYLRMGEEMGENQLMRSLSQSLAEFVLAFVC